MLSKGPFQRGNLYSGTHASVYEYGNGRTREHVLRLENCIVHVSGDGGLLPWLNGHHPVHALEMGFYV